MDKVFPLHVRTVTGLEEVLAEELSNLGAEQIELKSRLVTCVGDQTLLYKANLWCRTAIRVLRPLASFPARDEKELYKGIREIDWSVWLSNTGFLAIDADVRSSFTTHSLYLSQLAKDAVVDQFRDKTGERPSVDLDRPDLRICVSLFQNTAQIYIDASGESLHKRGYRLKAGEAPLSETLAAGIVKLSGWDMKSPLLDPMTGSGTFCIEAGLMLKNIAPGLLRTHFAFQRWPDYDDKLFKGVVEEAKKLIRTDAVVPIVGVEIDPQVAEIARQNVKRAGLTDLILIEQGDFFTWDRLPAVPGTLVMNPPYDERLGLDNVSDFYEQIGDRLKETYAGWTATVLSGNLEAVKCIGLRSSFRIQLFNGSIESRLLKYEMRAREHTGEHRKSKEKLVIDNPRWLAKAETFRNRLQKILKNYGKWAEREGIACWRVYDWDVPELPFILELYGDRLRFEEIPRNQEHGPIDHSRYMKFMVQTAAEVLKILPERVYFVVRNPKTASKILETDKFVEISESGMKFLVNLGDSLDLGLDLNHRKTRAMIQKQAAGKDVLSLYAYTGAFTLYAAAGGARSTTSVDTSGIYLEWAEKHLKLNGFSSSKHQLIRSEISDFLHGTKSHFDLCVIEPPTRSAQSDHVLLLRSVLNRMRPQGKVYFTTNYKAFEMDEPLLKEGRQLSIKEITQQTLSLDFDRKPSHRCWVIEEIDLPHRKQ